MHPGKTLQIWGPQPIWLSQREPPRNSVLGAGLKVKISLTSTEFPGSFLEFENLGQMLPQIILNYIKTSYCFPNKVPGIIHLKVAP